MLIGIALLLAGPALTAEFPPKISSFAYPFGHSSLDMPFDDGALPMQPPEPKTAAPAMQLASAEPGAPVRTPSWLRSELCTAAAFEAANNNLPIGFFANLIQQESNFRVDVVSHKGAQGIAQFMPGTAAERGLADPFDPIPALGASAKLLSNLRERLGNLGLAAAAYNAGPQRVADWLVKQGGMPAETQHYVRRITGIPVEEWARVEAKERAIRLPTHSQCPQLGWALPAVVIRMAIRDDEVRDVSGMRGADASSPRKRKRGARYAWWSRTSSLTYVSLR